MLIAPVHLPQARLEQVLDRFREVEARMGAASGGDEIVRLSKEHAELRPVVEAVDALGRTRGEIVELRTMADADDAEMAGLAREELETLNAESLPLVPLAMRRTPALSTLPGLLISTGFVPLRHSTIATRG